MKTLTKRTYILQVAPWEKVENVKKRLVELLDTPEHLMILIIKPGVKLDDQKTINDYPI